MRVPGSLHYRTSTKHGSSHALLAMKVVVRRHMPVVVAMVIVVVVMVMRRVGGSIGSHGKIARSMHWMVVAGMVVAISQGSRWVRLERVVEVVVMVVRRRRRHVLGSATATTHFAGTVVAARGKWGRWDTRKGKEKARGD